MKEKFMFSIIIPVYNCEKYITECLKGIFAQTFCDYEAIIVDDGSSDASVAIVREMVKDKPNFQIVLNRHGGVCKARNTGLELASGEYICFIDADDIVYEDYLSSLADAVTTHSSDVAYFYTKYGIGARAQGMNAASENKVINKEDLQRLSLATLYHVPELYDPKSKLYGFSSFSAGGQVYRRRLFVENDIRFTEGITLSEDGLVNLQVLKYAEKGLVIPKELYNYRTDNISATRSYKPDMIGMFAKRDRTVKEVIETLYADQKDAYYAQYYCSLLYELRMISEKCIFHPQNTEPFSGKKRQFLDLIDQPDYRKAVSVCGNCYLRPEDRAYLVHAGQGSALRVLLAIQKKVLWEKVTVRLKLWLKKAHLDDWIRRILRSVRNGK